MSNNNKKIPITGGDKGFNKTMAAVLVTGMVVEGVVSIVKKIKDKKK